MSEDDAEAPEGVIRSIQKAVADLFGLSVKELNGRSSQRTVSLPRHIAIYLVKQLTDASLDEIGGYFGGRRPSTVMNSIARIEGQRRTDTTLDRVLSNLSKGIKA
jgi:chromosomal replication initiator protein